MPSVSARAMSIVPATRSSVAFSGSVTTRRRRRRVSSASPAATRSRQSSHAGAAGSHTNAQPATISISGSSSASARTAVDFAVPLGPLTNSPPTAGLTS